MAGRSAFEVERGQATRLANVAERISLARHSAADERADAGVPFGEMQKQRGIAAYTVALSAVLGLAAGCAAVGAGAPEAKSVMEPEPTTVEQAQAQLERAHEQIEGAPSPPATPGGGAVAPAPVAPSEATQQTGGSACATACRAITSMRRAVDAICRIAGTADARCTAARKTLSDDEARVVPCGC